MYDRTLGLLTFRRSKQAPEETITFLPLVAEVSGFCRQYKCAENVCKKQQKKHFSFHIRALCLCTINGIIIIYYENKMLKLIYIY